MSQVNALRLAFFCLLAVSSREASAVTPAPSPTPKPTPTPSVVAIDISNAVKYCYCTCDIGDGKLHPVLTRGECDDNDNGELCFLTEPPPGANGKKAGCQDVTVAGG